MKEGLSPGIGRIRFDSGLEANYVTHRCERHTPETFRDSNALIIEVKTFDSVEAAAAELEFRRGYGGGTDTPTRLGDESITGRHHGEDAVSFRAGTAVVAMTLYDGPGRIAGDTHQALLPIAAAIIERLPRRS